MCKHVARVTNEPNLFYRLFSLSLQVLKYFVSPNSPFFKKQIAGINFKGTLSQSQFLHLICFIWLAHLQIIHSFS